jgi:hypothetical protein
MPGRVVKHALAGLARPTRLHYDSVSLHGIHPAHLCPT